MRKTTGSTIVLISLALSTVSSPLSAADRLRVGQWEVTSTGGGRTKTFKNCVSAAEAAATNGDAKGSRAYMEKLVPAQCAFTEYKVDGNSVSSVMTCGSTTVRSLTTYHGDAYESDSKTKTGAAAEVASHIKARRLGDCP